MHPTDTSTSLYQAHQHLEPKQRIAGMVQVRTFGQWKHASRTTIRIRERAIFYTGNDDDHTAETRKWRKKKGKKNQGEWIARFSRL